MDIEQAKKLLGDVVEMHAKGNIYFGKVERITEYHYLGHSSAELDLAAVKSNSHVTTQNLSDIEKLRVITGDWIK